MKVLCSIVTFNCAADLQPCLEAVAGQTVEAETVVLDNASQDESPEIARRLGVETMISSRNLGFSEGHNRILMGRDFDYALVVNPDCRLERDYLERLLHASTESGADMAQGKLLRMDRHGKPVHRARGPLLDSTGMYFTPTQRHFDRGSGETDRGQYERRQEVFGVTAAAALYSRRLLEAVRFEDEYFDTDFFTYREDADLSWRARLLGFRAVYEPKARALHRRSVLPQRRRSIAEMHNRHSLQNRFLMRIKNMDAPVARRCFPWMQVRDAGIRLYVLLRERSSLPAYRHVRRLKPRMLEKRRALEATGAWADLSPWFSFRPQAFDL
ncbi:MAG TPA: glycosyltransferase family 2 protein [Acidobacteriota bacterium]|nr:glycosyltransferase family 2 protein [Acidobacteriota bacterium]